MSTDFFIPIQAAFEAEEFETEILPRNEEVPVDRLLVGLGADDQERERIMELAITEPEGDEQPLLQFFVLLPFSATEDTFHETMRIIMRLNMNIPLMGFGISDENGMIFFRHVTVIPDEGLPQQWYSECLFLIGFSVDEFSPMIEQVASGEKTFEQIIEEASAEEE